jgi:glutamate racemase
MQEKIAGYLPQNVKLIAQGEIVAAALHDYLRRHPEMNRKLSQHGTREFLTTDNPENFNRHGSAFFGSEISSHQIEIPY